MPNNQNIFTADEALQNRVHEIVNCVSDLFNEKQVEVEVAINVFANMLGATLAGTDEETTEIAIELLHDRISANIQQGTCMFTEQEDTIYLN